MVKIFSALNSVEVHNLKNALEAQGIQCEIRGENLRTGLGELPVNECWTELWILDDSKVDEAGKIITSTSQFSGETWNCPGCGEEIEGAFERCWNCEEGRPEVSGE